MKQLLISLPLLLLAACQSKTAATSGGASDQIKIGLILDVGGRGDQSFNDGAVRGLETWAAALHYTASGYQPLAAVELDGSIPSELAGAGIKALGVKPVVLQAKAQEDYEPDLDLLVGEKVDLAIGVGFMLENAVEAAAKKHPNTKFLLIDSPVLDASNKPYVLPNVKAVMFRENEGTFLAGALAALTSKSGKIGFVGGMEVPLIRKFEAGYKAGVRAVKPDAEVKAVYTGSFDDSSAGKRVAQDLFSQGVDVAFHAAGSDGLGVIQAAKEANKLAIGCDSDQAHLAPANVLTSMVKHVDYAVYLAVKEIVDKKFTPGDTVLGLSEAGVGLAPVRIDVADKAAALGRIDKLRQAVVDGKVRVPATAEDLTSFAPPKDL
jgi:basic membrane protein A and related proteins